MVVSQSAPVVFLPTVLKKPSWVFAYRFYLSAVLFLFMLFLLTFHYSEVGFFVLVLLNTLFCADIFVRCAWKDLNQGQVGFALLVSVAVYAGFFYSALHTFLEHTLFSPVTELYLYVSFFLTLALWAQRNRILERERAGIYIKKIEDFLPKSARKCTGKTTRRVFAEELRPGDKILVKAGERFPCDGTITQGKTAIDEQLITGNMILAYKQKGNIVYAGTMNKSEAVYVSVEKVLAQSVLMHVMQTVQHSEQRRSIFTTDLDKSAAWMLLCLILVAGGQYAFLLYHYGVSTWLYYSSIFLLLLSLGAPLALLFCQPWPAFFAKCYAERKGIQIQNNHALEQIVQAEDVFFDKTGTLTCGQLTVECIHPLTEKGRKTLLKALITAEQQVDDPFARAVMSYAKEQEITPEKINSLEMLPGVGVRAVCGKDILLAGRIQWMEEQGISLPAVIYQTEETVICVAKNGACLGYVTLIDSLRPGAQEIVSFLKQQRKEIFLLSGDNEPAVAAVAKQVGIEKINAHVLPKTKAEIITNLRALGKKVVMVGDGFNDIIALLQADAGIVFASGKNVYNSWVDIVISRKDLYSLMDLFKINKKICRTSRFNAVLAFLLSVGWAEFLCWRASQQADWCWTLGGSLAVLFLIFINSMRLLKIK